MDRIGNNEVERWGRITPLDGTQQYLLEREGRQNQWYEVAKGGVNKVIAVIAGDTSGTFHGLGSVDATLRESPESSVQLPTKAAEPASDTDDSCPRFVYGGSDKTCTAQEALHLFFNIPLSVLVKPRGWYMRHRQPVIVEYSPDHSRVLVKFCQTSMSGDPIVGTCLYLLHDEDRSDADLPDRQWAAYTIRPNAGDTIAMAEAWIVKRKWKSW